MRINHNMMAMNTHRQLNIVGGDQSKSMEKLSSGYRINRAGDDAAGLAISEKMRAQVRGLNQASRNAQDGISLIQTAEGALTETHAILQRMRELAVQSSNDTNVEFDRGALQDEVNQLASEIDRIGNTTEFNTQRLLDGGNGLDNVQFSGDAAAGVTSTATIDFSAYKDMSVAELKEALVGKEFTVGADVITIADADIVTDFATSVGNIKDSIDGLATAGAAVDANGKITVTNASATDKLEIFNGDSADKFSAQFQIGANEGQTMTIEVGDMRSNALGVNAIDITDRDKATAAITTINSAIEKVSKQRSTLGAVQNRLEHTIKNLDTSAENLQAAESRVRDVDMAKEMMEFTKNNILQQASQAMLAQANQSPQGVLQLLR